MTAQPLSAPGEGADLKSAALEKYRREVTEVFGELNVQGLPETRHEIGRLRLDQIFVRLRLRMRNLPGSYRDEPVRRRGIIRESELARSLQNREPHGSADVDEREFEQFIQEERLAREIPESKPVDLAQAMADARHLAIIGAPGSGKTTMTRWLALMFARNLQGGPDRLGHAFKQPRLPVLIELRRLVAWIEDPDRWPGADGIIPRIAEFIADDPRFHGDVKASIQSAISVGACLLLFDGLDEIANPTTRRRIAESIQALARPDQGGTNLILVTSRPFGFRDIDLGPSFQVSEVQPFAPDNVREFLGAWYASAYGERHRKDAAKLAAEIESKDRIAALATNPLLCTVVAIVYRKGGQLPNRRVELYEECCKVLLETWDKGRGVERPIMLEGLHWSSKLTLLGDLAFRMHSQGEEVIASRDRIVAWLKPLLVTLRQISEAEAGMEAEDFISTIEDQAGLIQSRGDGKFEFPHRTFQEFLAARHIAEQPGDGAIDLTMPHLNEAWWEEVHLLTLGRMGGSAKDAEHAGRLMATLLDVYPKPWPLLHRTDWIGGVTRWLFPTWQWQRQVAWRLGRELALAAQGYADAKPEGRDPSIRKRLSSDVADLVAGFCRDRAVLRPLVGRRDSLVINLVSAPLFAALRDQEASVRRAAAEVLGQLGAGDPAVRGALLKALGDQEASVRGAAAGALWQLGAGDPKVRGALLEALGDQEGSVRSAAAGALGQLGAGDPEVRGALLETLGDQEGSVRSAAAGALGQLGAGDPKVRGALLEALGDQEGSVRSAAAGALGQLEVGDPEVRGALLEALGDQEGSVRSAAAGALGQLEAGDPEMRSALLQALGDQEWFVRRAAAGALGQLGAGDPEVRGALLEALGDQERFVRRAAAGALGQLGTGDPAVRGAVLKALGDQEWFVRRAAAEVLGQLGAGDPEVRGALVNALGDQEGAVRGAAAGALGQLGAGDPEVRGAVLKALGDQEGFVRRAAAGALGQLGAGDPEVRGALLKALGDQEWFVRSTAAEALGQLGAGDPDVRGALLKVLGEGRWLVKAAAARALGQLASKLGDHELSTVLRAFLRALNRDEAFMRMFLGVISRHETFARIVLYPSQHFPNLFNPPEIVTQFRDLMLRALSEVVEGRPLPGYRWVSMAERARRRRRWNLIRLGIYVVSFALLAALGLAALADELPKDSFLLKAGSIFVVLVPAIVAVAQAYDWLKARLSK